MVSGSVIGSSGRVEVAGGTPPDAPSLAPFPAWLSSSPCQGKSLPNGSSAPRVAGTSHSRRRCSRRRWCRGRSLGAPRATSGTWWATSRVSTLSVGWSGAARKSRAERLQTLRASPPSQLGFPPRRVRARACRTDRAPPAWPGPRIPGAGAVFGKRRAGWRNRMTGVWLRETAPKGRWPERHCAKQGS